MTLSIEKNEQEVSHFPPSGEHRGPSKLIPLLCSQHDPRGNGVFKTYRIIYVPTMESLKVCVSGKCIGTLGLPVRAQSANDGMARSHDLNDASLLRFDDVSSGCVV